MAADSSSFGTFELADIVDALRRRIRLIVMIAVPIILLGATLAAALPDVYRSTALFQLEQSQAPDANRYARSEYAERFIFALSDEIVRPESTAELLTKVDLYPEQGNSPAAAASRLRGDVGVEMVTARVLDPRDGLERDINTGFVLSYENRDPHRAEQGAVWLANAMLAAARQSRARDEQEAARFLGEQADQAREQIVESETRLADFKKRNIGRLPELAGSNLALLESARQELGSVDQQIASLRQNRTHFSQQVAELQEAGPGQAEMRRLEEEYQRKSALYSPDHPDIVALRRQIEGLDPATRDGGPGGSLQSELASKEAILAEARQRYSDDHPDVRRLTREIESLRARVNAGESGGRPLARSEPILIQSQNQLVATDSQLYALERRGGQLRTRLAELESRIASMPEVERNYWKLTRDIDNARKMYDELVNQKMEADVRAAAAIQGRGDEFRMLNPPHRPGEPARPQRLAIALVFVVIAVMAALSVALIAEMLDSSVRGSRDLARFLGAVPLAVVPEIPNSISRRRKIRDIRIAAAGILIGVPAAYLMLRFWFAG